MVKNGEETPNISDILLDSSENFGEFQIITNAPVKILLLYLVKIDVLISKSGS